MNTDRSVVDFETEAIESRPNYPPKPVGVSIALPGKKPEYLAWGHPEGNNCSVGTARAKLRDAYRHPTVFHNAGFDMDVSECFLNLKPAEYDDTMFLAFLNDPYERDLKLKSLAQRQLDEPPTERDELRDWILTNIKEAKRKKNKWGEFIHLAPGDLVGKYANGDARRTRGLYEQLRPIVDKRGMSPAYNRELAVLPIVMDMERSGVRVNLKALRKAKPIFKALDAGLVKQIKKRLGVTDPEFNVNSSPQLSKALVASGKLSALVRTKKGAISTKIDILRSTCTDKHLLNLLAVHSVCEKYVTSFINPWIEQAEKTDGRILPRFNQVPNDGGGGARSGRFSSSDPNLQNVPADIEESKNKDTLLLLQRWLQDNHGYRFLGLRDFIEPDPDCIIAAIDYNQQELRLLGHFEEGVLAKAYNDDPRMDIHEFVRQLIYKTIGILFERKHVKITVFGIVYGMGVGKLAERLGVDRKTATRLRDGILEAVPGIKRLMNFLKNLERHGKPLVTWGGREYFCEEPRYVVDDETGDKRFVSFEYKMLNYLIQPSAADYTKQGMINVAAAVPQARIALQVHDELVCMVRKREHGLLIAEAMCEAKLKVPMLADPKFSDRSWARVA